MDNESSITDLGEHADATVDRQSTEIVEQLLIEEISIDGMCGVY